METNEKQKHLRFFGIPKILPFLNHVRVQIMMMVSLAITSSFVDITIPQFQRYALDTFVGKGSMAAIIPFVIAYIAVILLASVVNYISCSQATIVEMKVNRELRQVGFKHLQTLSFSYFNQNSVGYIHARLMSDTGRIGGLVSWWLIDCTWRISYLVGAVFVMIRMNTKLALMVLTTVPLLILLFAIFQKKLEEVNHEVREINSKITGNFNEGIMGAKTIKSLSIEEKMEKRFTAETENMRNRAIQASRLRGLFAATMNFASSAALAIILWKGGYIALEEIGTFSVFMSYAQGMMEPLRWLVDIVSDLITTQVNIERFTNLLAVQSDVIDTPEVVEKYGDCFEPKKENWEPIKGDIEFQDVTFRYPDGEETVLEHFSLRIPFGTHIAIVGETGAGKSTLVNLVCRFYEPTQGQLLIDGRDARERSQLWLHSAIGYVLQTPHLFSGTVRENLLIGNPNANEEQIREAIRMVSADEVIAHLEKGLDTDVGEGGDLLSTGEKQLISFARAILADPKILILDEATASVDTMTEAKIQSAMESVTKGRTSLMIAHRLSTVRNADLILVVKEVNIMEILKATNLSKIYQTGESAVYALNEVSLTLQEGSFVAITGPSGSGKSTLLHLLSGLDKPTHGTVHYRDKELYKYNDNQLSVLRRRRFGFVFQSYNLVKELTGWENMLLPIMLDSKKPDEAHLNRLVEMLGISDRLSHLPGAMSGGQQQRFSIARALANKPAILFADEPTGNLDGKAGREVLTLLRTVSRELGITLVLVTHDMTVAEQADRIVRLRDGQIAHDSGVV